MTPEQLKASIIQSALEGKITQQRSEDTPVAETLNRIQELRNAMIKRKEIKKVAVLPIDDTVPFDIPDSWKWVRIGAIEEINLGFTYRPEYTDEGVYFLSVKDISGGKIDFQNAKKVSQETYDNAAYGSKPRKGDILFGRVGTMGKPQIIDTDEPFCIFVSLGFFRDHTNIVVKEYISLWMQSVLFNKQVDENVKGSAQRNLNTGWLKDFYIPFPPIEEQHRIVAQIEELLPYIDRYAEAYEKLEQFNAKFPEDMKKSILQYAIQGKLVEQRPEEGTAEELYQQIQDEKQKLIKDKRIKKEKPLAEIAEDEIPFDIPDSWKWCRIGSVFTLQAGKNITASQIYNDKSEKTQYPC
ncbi:MAG: restriction endonuclease subunit S, partial [Lachnospiraceae bacterium]|nr:restriction endonuclease subunit S [Lachnospiraceae bacterium]